MMDSFFQISVRRKIYIVALIVAYLGSRLYFLTRLPVFIDEALHIQRAQQTLQGDLLAGMWPTGKWLAVKIMALFVSLPFNALLTARLASVLIGVGTLVACVQIGSKLFSQKEGLIAGSLYVLLPYALFYDRAALTDGFQTAFGAWTLLLSIMVVRSPSRVYIVMLVFALIASILSRLTGALFMLIPLCAVFILTPRAEWRKTLRKIAPSLLGALALLSLFFWKGVGTGEVESKAVGAGLSALWALAQNNLELASNWFWMLLTPPIAVLAVLSLVWLSLRSRTREDWFVVLVLFMSVMPYILGAKIWFPRYLLFAVVPISLLTARFLCLVESKISLCFLSVRWRGAKFARSVFLAGGALGLIVWPTLLNASIVAHPECADLPQRIRYQFVTGWPSGYGLVELAGYLNDLAASEPDGINVLRFYYWNHPYQGLDLYLAPSDSLAIYTLDPSSPDLLAQIEGIAATRRTFFVLNPPVEAEHLESLDKSLESYIKDASRVWHHSRPGGESGLEVWEVYGGGRTGGVDATTLTW
jgi:hypothetical protein